MTKTTHQPYQLGAPCTVAYLHRDGHYESNATVTGVRQLVRRDGWMVTARAHDTGLEIDTRVRADGSSLFLAPGHVAATLIPHPQYAPISEPTDTERALFTPDHQIVATVHGPQGPAVTSHNRHPGDGRPAVLVSYCGLITICHDPIAVGRRARAWAGGVELAINGHLPQTLTIVPSASPLVSAGIIAAPDEPFTVTGHGTGNARNGQPDVIVRGGSLSVRCLDQDALVSIAAAWADADRLARVLWGAESMANRTLG